MMKLAPVISLNVLFLLILEISTTLIFMARKQNHVYKVQNGLSVYFISETTIVKTGNFLDTLITVKITGGNYDMEFSP
jgi:hypothetical protein